MASFLDIWNSVETWIKNWSFKLSVLNPFNMIENSNTDEVAPIEEENDDEQMEKLMALRTKSPLAAFMKYQEENPDSVIPKPILELDEVVGSSASSAEWLEEPAVTSETRTLQDVLDSLVGVLLAIEIDFSDNGNFLPMMRIIIPYQWHLLDSFDFLISPEQEMEEGILAVVTIVNPELILDDMVDFVHSIISYNQAIIDKQRELEEIREQKEIELLREI